ncbi:unnamed protein product, partial [Ectocarpus sp. 12 AP-2014]
LVGLGLHAPPVPPAQGYQERQRAGGTRRVALRFLVVVFLPSSRGLVLSVLFRERVAKSGCFHELGFQVSRGFRSSTTTKRHQSLPHTTWFGNTEHSTLKEQLGVFPEDLFLSKP